MNTSSSRFSEIAKVPGEGKLVSKRRWGCQQRSRRAVTQLNIPHNLDLLEFPTILFYETGYSTYVLRQASRRSWRIGQKRPVRVGFLTYAGTAQESCLRLMGKKLMVSLAMEGKLRAEGLQAIDQDDDLLTAMARELVTRQGVGERAAEVWRALTKVRESVSGVSVVEDSGSRHTIEIPKAPEKPKSWIPSTGPSIQLSLF